jgi:transforming growth factor-beta-induced protein
MKSKLMWILGLGVALVALACTAGPTATPMQPPPATNTPAPMPTMANDGTPATRDIVDTAAADGRFTTLLTAVDTAGLEDTLRGEGPFTVFAPTDEAFAQLPEGTVEALLEDTPALTNILLYHLVAGRVYAEQVVTMDSSDTVQGQAVSISVEGDQVRVNDALVIITDIRASNGVIHVIDSVLLPPEPALSDNGAPMDRDIVDTAAADGRFTTLLAAVEATGLENTLREEGPFTVFAPTDEAFAQLPEGTVEGLLDDTPALTNILLYHVVAGRVYAEQVVTMDSAETVQGEAVNISLEEDQVRINDALVIITDIEAANGVIHVIDSVLLPPGS